MSDSLGTMVYVNTEQDTLLGRMASTVSETTQQKDDAEIRLILDAQYARARALLEWETVDAYQVNDIMSGRPPRPPKVKPPEDDTSDGGASGRQSNDSASP